MSKYYRHFKISKTWKHVLASLFAIFYALNLSAVTYTVTNTNSAGSGSFDAAINSLANGDVINFNISSGSAPWVINLPSGGEVLSVNNVLIDATTQPGYAGTPVIQFDGLTNSTAIGLQIKGSNANITGISFTNFSKYQLYINADNATITDCYFGVAPDGHTVAVASSSTAVGIYINGRSGSVIGTSGNGNLIATGGGMGIYLANGSLGTTSSTISYNIIGENATGTTGIGSQQWGLYMDSSSNGNYFINNVIGNCSVYGVYLGADDNTLQGNIVGLKANGLTAIPNGIGMYILNSGEVVGGNGIGQGNTISGNTNEGIFIEGSAGGGTNFIEGNKIGVDAITGTIAIANGASGITIKDGTNTSNIIGGTITADRNIISGNTTAGIYLINTSGNTIESNYIGLNKPGNGALPNGQSGVKIDQTSTHNIIGGSSLGSNYISGNTTYGIYTLGSKNTFSYNYIGLRGDQTNAQGNGADGIFIDGSTATIVTGTLIANNTIASNNGNGIFLRGRNSDSTIIAANIIGTNSANAARPNTANGINVESSNNTIGGTTASSLNTIAGNTLNGILLNNVSNINIWGNYIGVDQNGNLGVANGGAGIYMANDDSFISIGVSRGNVISGNGAQGIWVLGSHNQIQNNIIGLEALGVNTIANGSDGIYIYGVTSTNAYSTNISNNTISGNTGNGIKLDGVRADTTVITNNNIGMNVAGTAAKPNTLDGIYVRSAYNTIGGSSALRNYISGNGGAGIHVSVAGPNTIQSNYIGLNEAGSEAPSNVGNGTNGITLDAAASGVTIGGSTAAKGNIISGNTGYGIFVGVGSPSIQANWIGLNAAGSAAAANTSDGIYIGSGSSFTIGTVSGVPNIISGNGGNGINISSTAGAETIVNTYIGLASSGIAAIGNSLDGIIISNTAGDIIGDTISGSQNFIAGNVKNGINIAAGANFINANYIGMGTNLTTSLGNTLDGILVSTSNNQIGTPHGTVKLFVSGNTHNGINITANSNTVQNVVAGLNGLSATAMPNTLSGILITSNSNTIGGTTAIKGNLISGNTGYGLTLGGSATLNNIIGNIIGANAAVTSAFANASGGINITGTATINKIGGNAAGSRNYISGNTGNGITEAGSGLDTIVNNYIGVAKTGISILSNTGGGIYVTSDGNQIGKRSFGNIISGNTGSGGVYLSSGAGNIIDSNYIGTNASGSGALGNGLNAGVTIVNGTATIIERNVISGNISGIVESANSSTITGNIIGLNASGNGSVPNAYGIFITGTASGVTIGGNTAAARNVISGNSNLGIWITAGGHTITGNYIGLGTNGTSGFSNVNGVELDNAAGTVTLGGTTASLRNIISGNSGGVYVTNGTPIIEGNYIGTDDSGKHVVANGYGIYISTPGVTVGGTSAGAGNLISGYTSYGIWITANTTTVVGNYFSTDYTGNKNLISGPYNVWVNAGSGNVIGGTTAGTRNVFGGTSVSGSSIYLNNTSATTVEGNLVGWGINQTTALPGSNGIYVSSTGANIIGGTTSVAKNVIANFSTANVTVVNAASTTVEGNFIGLKPNGKAPATITSGIGVLVGAGASGNTIGGTTPATANYIASNSSYGIEINNSNSNLIYGNVIGHDSVGDSASNTYGIYITGGASNNVIGNPSVVGSEDTIVDNINAGVAITGTTSTGNSIRGNSIYSNGHLGIDLNNDGETNNHNAVTSGPNGYQNFPVLVSKLLLAGPSSKISGTLSVPTTGNYLVDFYSNTLVDITGYGQGKVYLGNTTVNVVAANTPTSFTYTVAGNWSSISATATSVASGNTSEFDHTLYPQLEVFTTPSGGDTVDYTSNQATIYQDSTIIGSPITRRYYLENIGGDILTVADTSTHHPGFSETDYNGGFIYSIPDGVIDSVDVTLQALANGTYSKDIIMQINQPGKPIYQLNIFGWVGCWNAEYVDPVGGNNANTGSASNKAKKTIQAAINAACNNGTVYMVPATYAESPTVTNKNLFFSNTFASATVTKVNGFTLNASSDSITLLSPLTINNGTLTLTHGRVITSSTAMLLLDGNSANISGGSITDYIDGPVQFSIYGTQTKNTTLPIGKGLYYRPISLYTDITDAGAVGNTFQAEMFNVDPHTKNLSIPSLTNLSYTRYWQVDRKVSNGTVNNAQITLNFRNDGTNDSINDLTNVKILKGTTSGTWTSIGGTASSILAGTYYIGNVQSVSFNTFSPFALATGCGQDSQPKVNFTFTNSCVNSPVSFTNTSTIAAGYNIVHYVIDYGDGSAQVSQVGVYPPNPAMPSHTYTTPGTYAVSIVATSNKSCQVVVTKYITINPLPNATIVGTPEICSGSTASMTVNVSNILTTDSFNLSYNIGASPFNLKGKGPGNYTVTTAALTSTTSATLTNILNITTGCSKALSEATSITVDPTSAGGSIASAATVCSGNNSGTLTLSSNVGNVVKWQYSTNAGATWTDIINTTTSQAYSNLTVTTMYRAVVQSGVCATATSSSVTITVNSLPTATISSATSICNGFTASLPVVVANTGGASWSIGYTIGTTPYTFTGTGNGIFSLTTVALYSSANLTLNSITLTSGIPICTNTLSAVAAITVNPLPNATIATGTTICSGSTATIQVNVSNVATTDGWKLNYKVGAVATTLKGAGPGNFYITTSALSTSPTIVKLTSVVDTTTGCTEPLTTDSSIVIVNPTTVAGSVSASATVCSGNNSGTLTLSGNTGSVVKWQYSTNAGATWTDIANTTTSYAYTNLTATTVFRAVVQSGVCLVANSGTATITVDQLPTATISGSATICAATTTNLSVTISNVNPGQTWTLTYLEGSNTKTYSNTGSGTFTIASSVLYTTTNYSLQSINITAGAPLCSNSSLTGTTSATVTVNQLPFATLGAGSTICKGSTATLIVNVSDVASSDNWKLTYDEGASVKNITGTGPGNFTITTSALTTTTVISLASIQNTTTTCSQSVSDNSVITVSQPTVPGSVSPNATVCYGNNSGAMSVSGYTGTVIGWEYSVDNGNTWTSIVNTSTGLLYSNLTTTTLYHAIIQNGVCAAAASANDTITVKPLPLASFGSGSTICAGLTSSINVSVSNVSAGQGWTITYLEGSSTKTLNGTGPGNFTITTSVLNNTTTYTLESIVITSGAPTCSNLNLTSGTTATVTVNPRPDATIGSGSTICSGSTANITVTIANVLTSDAWQLNYTEGVTAKHINGTGPGDFTITTSALSSNTVVTLTGIQNTTTSCSQVVSGSATIIVSPTTVPGTVSANATVCYGTNSGSMTLSGNNGTIVKWQYSVNNGTTWTDIANTSSTQSYLNLTATTLYHAVVQSGICAAANSTNDTITVDVLPVATINAGTTTCSGSTATLTVTTSHTRGAAWTVTYNEGTVTSKTLNGTGDGNFTLTTNALSTASTTSFDVTLTGITMNSGASPLCSNTLNSVAVVTVSPLPFATIGSGSTICSGSTGSISVTVSDVAATDAWKLFYTEGATPKNIAGTGPGIFTITTAALSATTTVSFSSVQNVTTSCTQNVTGSATITVNPTTVPGTAASNASVCYGSNSGTLNLTGNTGSVVKWQYSSNSGATWTDIVNTNTSQTYLNLTATTLYHAVVQSGVCPAGNSTNDTITVNVLPTASVNAGTTTCAGSTATLTVTVAHTRGAAWTVNFTEGTTSRTLTGINDGSFTLTTLASSTASTSSFDVTLTGITMNSGASPLCSNTLNSVAVVTVTPLPFATIGSGSTICSGSTANVSVTVSDVAATDNWKLSYTEGVTSKNITGTGPGIFTITTSALATTTNVVLTNILNNTTTCTQNVSGTATITVNPTTVPGSVSPNASVCFGTNSGTMTLSGNNGSILKWQYSANNGVTWTDIVNTTNSQTFLNLTATTLYHAVVQSGVCLVANSSNDTVTVNALPTASVNAGTTTCAGSTATLTVTVAHTRGAAWTVNFTEGTTARTLTGINDGSFTLTTLASSTASTSAFDVTLTGITMNSGVSPLCSNVLNSVATVTVTPLPFATIGSGSTICSGSTATVNVTVSDVSATDAWKLNYSEGVTSKFITGTGPGNFTITTASLVSTTNVILSSIQNTTTGCIQNVTGTATITVNPTTIPGAVTPNASVCFGSNSGTMTLGGNNGSILKWQYSANNGATWTDIVNTTSTQTYLNLTTTTLYHAVVQSGVCLVANSANDTITVNVLPTASVNAGTTTCAGSTATLTVTVAHTRGAAWTVNFTEGTTARTLTGVNDGSFTLTTLASSTASTSSFNVTLTGITMNSGATPLCSNALNSVATVTVTPLPYATIGSGSTICSGNTATVNVTISDVSATDAWQLNYTEGLTAKNITGTGPGNFTITTAALASTTNVVLVSIKNTTTGCIQNVTGTATITVNPTTVPGTVAASATVCYGTNGGTLNLTGNTGSVLYWQYSVDAGATWTNIANTTTSETYSNLTATTVYRAVVQSGTCPIGNSVSSTITVNQLPTAVISGGTTICAGLNTALTVNVANVSAVQTWTLTYLEGSNTKTLTGTGSGNFTLTTSVLTASTNYQLQSIVISSGLPLCSNANLTGNTSATVTVNPRPDATIGSGSTICSGNTGVINVTVANMLTSDNWTLSYTEGLASKTITGTGPGNFTITTAALSSTTIVSLVSIQNTTSGCSQAVSGSATITVNPTSIGGTLSSNAIVCNGNNSGTINLIGNTGSVINWQSSVDGGVTWANIANTASTESYSNLTATTIFRAVVQSGVCPSANSSNDTITVKASPNASIAGGTTICANTTANLTVTISNVSASQKWTLTYLEGSNTKTLSGTGSGNFTLTTSILVSTTNYTLQAIAITSGVPTCSNANLTGNTSATITVRQLPTVTISSSSSDVCTGTSGSFTVNVSNVATTDNWSMAYTTTNPTASNIVTGTGPGTFTINTANLSGGASSKIKITSITNTTTTCSINPLDSVIILIDPATVAGTLTGNATVCYGTNSGTITATGGTGSIIRWEYSIDAGASWRTINNTTSSLSYSNLITTTLYRAVYQSGACAAIATSAITITTNTLPVASISGSVSICSGNTANLTITTSNTHGQSWTINYLEGTNSKTLSGTGDGTFTLTTGVLTSNTTETLQSITLTSGSPLCSNSSLTGSASASVTVNPIPSASISGTTTICTGSSPVFYVTVTNVPAGNNWTLSYNEGATAKTLTGSGSGSFQMNASTLTNAGITATTVTYTLTNIVNNTNVPNCNNGSFTGTEVVTINPATVGGTLSGSATTCGTINSGTITLSGNVGAIVRWEYSTDNGTTWNNIANTTTSQAYNNLGTTTIYRALVQSGVCAAVYSGTATITVNAQPTASVSGSQTICSGSTPSITVTVSNVPSGQGWSLNYLEGVTNKTLTGTGSGSFTLNASTLTNGTSSQISVKYTLSTITNTTLSCTSPALTTTYTVYIDPTAVGGTLSTATPTVCSGSNGGTITLSGQVGSIVRWEYSVDGGATWIYIVTTTNSQTFSNLTTTTKYRVLVSSGTCGNTYSTTQTITVNPLPMATVSGTASICTNNTSPITFTISNVGASDNWTLNYTVNSVAAKVTGTGPGVTTVTPPTLTYPPVSVVYSLVNIVNNTSTCSNNLTGSATITVNPKPIVSFTSTDMCLGTAINYTNGSSVPVGNISGYAWNFGDGKSSTDINPNHVFSAAGAYNVKLVVTTVAGCKDSLTKASNVFPNPVASFTEKNTCESDSAVFTSTSTVSSGKITSYNWDFGDQSSSTLTSPKHKYTYTGTFNVGLVVTSDKGCTNSTSSRLTVYPMPTANFIAQAVCAYDSMQFVNASSVPYGSLTYNWTFESGKTSTAADPKFKFANSGNYTVKLVATSNYGCHDSVFNPVTINAVPVAGFTYGDVCLGKVNVFKNTSTVANDTISSSTWNFADSSFGAGNVQKHTYAHSGNYKVLLTVQSGKGCIDTVSHSVTVHALPVATITSTGPLSVCTGNTVMISAPAGLTYAWSTGATTQAITASKTGEYTVVVTDKFGCSSDDSTHVTIWPLPVVSAGHDTTVSKGFSADLHGSGGVTYTWSPPATLDNPNSSDPTATPLTTTLYTMVATDANGCSNSDTVRVFVNDDHRLIIYNMISPNGDGKNDAWTIGNISTYNATVTIYNRYGIVVYQSTNYQNDWKGTYNGQDLPEGTYYYTITFSDDSGKVYKGAVNILRNK